MRKTNFTVLDPEWSFIAKIWPKDGIDTADDPLWIVAGTQKEFEDFVIKKRMMGLHFDYRYVASANVLRGLTRIRGFYIGTYKERLDWDQIESAIQIIKSRGG